MSDLQHIKDAQNRLKGIVVHTTLSYAPVLSKISNADVYIKKENVQNTGSFKLRGAFNKIATLSKKEQADGIIAASAGNHAQGVAYSAKYFDINATIVMPEATPLTKVNGAKEHGAKVVLFGSNYDESYSRALEIAKRDSLTLIHPFSDDDVINGQATVALEILEDNPNIDTILVPIGGGGLITGVAKVAKAINKNIKIIGVVAKGAPAMKLSFEQKNPISTKSVKTIADGIAVRDTIPKMLDYVLQLVDDIVEVNEEEIASAILFLLEKQKLVVEGAGATGVAAILHNKIDISGKNVALILSGGNIDVTMLSVIIEKGLLKSNRKIKLMVTLMDKSGALNGLTNLLSDCSANIVQIDYDRTSVNLEYGDANVTLAMETKGIEDIEKIREVLIANGYKYIEI
jgi:threonine dehydratase